MREEPIISRAWIKAALVVLIGGALGLGAYVLASDSEIDLPDLPEVDLDELDPGGTTTNVSETTLEDTTVGVEQEPPDSDPFTSAAFAEALAKVRDAVGPGKQLTRVSVNDTQTQFSVRRGDEIEVYSVRADGGDLSTQDATVTITGTATLADFAFPLDAVDPAAVDRMLGEAARQSGDPRFHPTVLNLERQIPFGSRELAWTISAEAGDRNLTYRAAADGRQVKDVGGGGTAIPPQAKAAEQLNDCIQAAGTDIDEVTACFEDFSP